MSLVTVIVTGSRNWTDRQFIYEALDIVLDLAKGVGPVILKQGKCPKGADRMAVDWYEERKRKFPWVRNKDFPADWDKYGLAAGHVRNREMALTGADWCLAFIKPCVKLNCRIPYVHGSHGAEGCADLAEGFGISTKRFRTF
jgi:hypothetical protein